MILKSIVNIGSEGLAKKLEAVLTGVETRVVGELTQQVSRFLQEAVVRKHNDYNFETFECVEGRLHLALVWCSEQDRNGLLSLL